MVNASSGEPASTTALLASVSTFIFEELQENDHFKNEHSVQSLQALPKFCANVQAQGNRLLPCGYWYVLEKKQLVYFCTT